MSLHAEKKLQGSSNSQAGFAELISPVGGVIIFTPGSVIFEESDRGSSAYLIQKGYVEISRGIGDEKKVISLLGPGEIFGEIAVLDGDTRSATAVAIHETTLAPITQQQIHSAIATEDPLTQLLLHSAIRRLRRTLDNQNEIEDSGNVKVLGKDDYFQSTQKKAIEYINSISSIKTAVENNDFQLYYQPIVNLSSGMIAGYESLLRGPKNYPELLSPATFIPIAEESGLIVMLGEWVLKTGLNSLHRFEQEAKKLQLRDPLFMSINVSPKQIESPDNVERMVKVIEQSNVNTERIKLEITETALLSNPELAMSSLHRLSGTGVKIAIDDFGTGYSSLNYLHRYPLDTMKIDRSFINNLSQGENGIRIVSAILNLARDLKMDVVAEGIEQKKELDWLCKRNCQYGQGYYLAKPTPINEALAILPKAFF